MPLIMVGSCVVVTEGESLLLVKRNDNGLWGLPGGSLEPGESMEEVARRELFEETGLKAKELKLLDIYSGQELYYKYPHGDEVYNVIAAYVCEKFKGVMKPEESEVSEIRFFKLDEIPININPPDKPVIDCFTKLNRKD